MSINSKRFQESPISNRNLGIFKPSEEIRDLRLLEELERNPITSQRELSHKFNIALGVTNACLRRMVLKGWIRIRDLNHRRIGYYLTPKGFAGKAELTLHLLSYTVHHYSELKRIINKRLLEMESDGKKRIVFYGVSDEMEVAYITLQGLNMELVGIVDEGKNPDEKVFGYKVIGSREVNDLDADAILITSMKDQNSYVKALTKQKRWDPIKIFTI